MIFLTGNTELLNYIYQNSEMGIATLEQLINITQDEKLKEVLESQYKEYKKVKDSSQKMLSEHHKKAKEINKMAKISSYTMLNMKTIINKTPSHISQMLIQGSTMGIIEITKNLNNYKDADENILDLANDLLEFEQRNVEELKKFLS